MKEVILTHFRFSSTERVLAALLATETKYLPEVRNTYFFMKNDKTNYHANFRQGWGLYAQSAERFGTKPSQNCHRLDAGGGSLYLI